MISGLYKPLRAGESKPGPPRVAPASISEGGTCIHLRLQSVLLAEAVQWEARAWPRGMSPSALDTPARRLPRVALDTVPSTGQAPLREAAVLLGVHHLGAATCAVSSQTTHARQKEGLRAVLQWKQTPKAL